MSEIDRLYRYKTLLSRRRAMAREDILNELEISPATFKRGARHTSTRDGCTTPCGYAQLTRLICETGAMNKA